MLTHRNLVANVLQATAVQSVDRPDDTLIGVLPFFHIYGMSVIMNAVLRGGATVVHDAALRPRAVPRPRRGAPRHQGAPRAADRRWRWPSTRRWSGYDLSSLQLVNSGAAPLSAELAGAAAERIGCPVVQGYGMTETSPVTHATPPDRRTGPARSARAMPEHRVPHRRRRDRRGARPGEEGELCIRGPQVMHGYLDDARGDRATPSTPTAGCTPATSATPTTTATSYLVDRLKELIKYKGFQVAPAELEAVLSSTRPSPTRR